MLGWRRGECVYYYDVMMWAVEVEGAEVGLGNAMGMGAVVAGVAGLAFFGECSRRDDTHAFSCFVSWEGVVTGFGVEANRVSAAV